MKRVERLYALVDQLRGASGPMPASRLAREFEVSTRTIERDMGSLQLAGVPIYADTGVHGGYSILREHTLPPLNLSAAESLAVLAGLGLLESSPHRAAARSARAKILAVVADGRHAALRRSLESIRVIDAPGPEATPVPLDLLARAADGRRVVRLSYRSDDGLTVTSRDVETMGLLRGGDSWMLVGWCRLRSGIRGFQVHRITALEVIDEVPPERDPAILQADLARWPTRDLAG